MTDEKNQFLTLMFVDIPSVFKVRELEGGDAAHKYIEDCVSLLSVVRKKHSGSMVRTVGSTILCSFQEPSDAVHAARSMQDAFDQKPVKAEIEPVLRIGIHCGDVILRNGACTGETVTTAARIVTMAKPHQIVVTEDVTEKLSSELKGKLRPLELDTALVSRLKISLFEVSEKNRGEGTATAAADVASSAAHNSPAPSLPKATVAPVEQRTPAPMEESESDNLPVVEIDDVGLEIAPQRKELDALEPRKRLKPTQSLKLRHLNGEPKNLVSEVKENAATPGLRENVKQDISPAAEKTEKESSATAATQIPEKSRRPRLGRLCLVWHRKVYIIDAHRPILSIGRDDNNDIILGISTASRRHAEVEMRNDGYYYIDHSWNGTYVYDENGKEKVVHNAELKVENEGVICPGCPGDEEGVEAIRFVLAS